MPTNWGSRSFGGGSDHITIASGYDIVVNAGQPNSVSFWMNLAGAGSGTRIIMEASGTGGFQLYVNSGGHLILDKQGVENDITQTATLATNVWTHIGISHATLGGSGNYILYINGVNTQSGAGAGGLFTTGLTYLFGDP